MSTKSLMEGLGRSAGGGGGKSSLFAQLRQEEIGGRFSVISEKPEECIFGFARRRGDRRTLRRVDLQPFRLDQQFGQHAAVISKQTQKLFQQRTMFGRGLGERDAHPFLRVHDANHAFCSQFGSGSSHRYGNARRNRKWRRDIEIAGTQSQIGELAANRWIVLFRFRRIAPQPFAQLTLDLWGWVLEAQPGLLPGSFPGEFGLDFPGFGRSGQSEQKLPAAPELAAPRHVDGQAALAYVGGDDL